MQRVSRWFRAGNGAWPGQSAGQAQEGWDSGTPGPTAGTMAGTGRRSRPPLGGGTRRDNQTGSLISGTAGLRRSGDSLLDTCCPFPEIITGHERGQMPECLEWNNEQVLVSYSCEAYILLGGWGRK